MGIVDISRVVGRATLVSKGVLGRLGMLFRGLMGHDEGLEWFTGQLRWFVEGVGGLFVDFLVPDSEAQNQPMSMSRF